MLCRHTAARCLAWRARRLPWATRRRASPHPSGQAPCHRPARCAMKRDRACSGARRESQQAPGPGDVAHDVRPRVPAARTVRRDPARAARPRAAGGDAHRPYRPKLQFRLDVLMQAEQEIARALELAGAARGGSIVHTTTVKAAEQEASWPTPGAGGRRLTPSVWASTAPMCASSCTGRCLRIRPPGSPPHGARRHAGHVLAAVPTRGPGGAAVLPRPPLCGVKRKWGTRTRVR